MKLMGITISRTLMLLGSAMLLTVSACSEVEQTDAIAPPQISMNLPGPITPEHQHLPEQPQGIRGQVQHLQGNHMPTVEPSSGIIQPDEPTTNTRLWVFSAGVRPEQGPYLSLATAQQHDNLIGWTTTEPDGTFILGLPVGDYTLLIESDNGLYFNSFTGDGSYASVTVTQNAVTDIILVNSENAVF